jgi:serine/threonine protein kinase
MPVTVEQFVECLTHSGLMAVDEIRAVQGGYRDAERYWDVESLCKELVRRGKITSYQAQVLRQGRFEGLVIGDYVVQDKIGAGGMGEVFKAVHRHMQRLVALKVLSAEATKNADLVARFQREVRAVARLEHPNIVTAYDAGQTGGTHFLVMQFIDGCDLSVYVKEQRGCLPVDEALNYLLQAARGLEHAHTEGIIHRDVKPSNLLLDRRGVVKLLDLGLAVFTESPQPGDALDRRLTVAGERLGTANYMSPEQAVDTRSTDARSDIYSLGCTLHFLLTGDPPFRRRKKMQVVAAHQHSPAPSLCDVLAEVPPALDAVFQRMLAKIPEERYQSMRETIVALEDVRRSGMARRPVRISLGEAAEDSDVTAYVDKPGESAERPRPLSSRDTVHALAKQDTDHSSEALESDAGAEDDDFLVIMSRHGKSQRDAQLADRQAAQWVLVMGGGVVIVEADGRRRRVSDMDALPAGPFLLETVGLAYNQLVADADLIRFADAGHLARIYLDGTNITDQGLRHLPNIASLVHLALGNTKVTSAGMASLAACSALKQLSLYATQVDDAAVANLRHMTALEKLNLMRTQLTPAAVEELRRALPACEILF